MVNSSHGKRNLKIYVRANIVQVVEQTSGKSEIMGLNPDIVNGFINFEMFQITD